MEIGLLKLPTTDVNQFKTNIDDQSNDKKTDEKRKKMQVKFCITREAVVASATLGSLHLHQYESPKPNRSQSSELAEIT